MVIYMKIQRIDDKTVKCFLSNAELEEYEIDYKDFILRSDKAKEVVREIIEQAEVEVGYKLPKFAFDLQIMMLPDQGLLLTFSEKEPFEGREGEQAIELLKQVGEMLQQKRNELSAQAQAAGKSSESPVRIEFAIFAFDSLRDVMTYAEAMPAGLRVRSALYLMDGRYYLYLHKGAASYERYSRACVQALEFSALYGADEIKLLFLQEHGERLIAEKALKKLRLS